jgi:hypothetical protein
MISKCLSRITADNFVKFVCTAVARRRTADASIANSED